MTCKNCLHSRVCFDSEGTTRYYGTEIAADNVEDLCPCFADRSRYVVREKGEWVFEHNPITDPKGYFIRIVCPKCNLHTGQVSNFCPNCGADMRAAKEKR